MRAWFTFGRLILDDEGHLWERYCDGLHWHGPIDGARAPAGLEAEFDLILDAWHDALRDSFDSEAEQLWYYRLSVLD